MTKQIIPFTSDEFGTIRTVEQDGKVMFCGKDVAEALGYKRPKDAIAAHCKGAAIHRPLQTEGGMQQARFITEGDLYRLVASSKLPSAQKFESWVFDGVLPSIRKRGGYMAARDDETPEQVMARALLLAQDTMDRQRREIDEMRPKALFADAVAASDGTCLIGELGKAGGNRNVSTQRAMEMGLFRIKETAVTHSDGHVTINRTPKVTGRGQRYFIDRYCKAVDER